MPASFAELLRRYRIAASLTQEALAFRCGLSPATIATLETGRRKAPRLSTVADIADALKLSPDDRALLATAARSAAPADLSQPKTAGGAGAARNSLPAPITPLVGRLAEVAAIADELGSERLVTLVGPGGVGKTRLALRVAAATADKFPGGTWWIELGPVTDPDGVASAVLRTVGASEQPGTQVSAEIIAALPDDRVLLVIDNCEHVLGAAAGLIGELLRAEPVTVLATSREPLAIPGEVNWQVQPLGVPAPGAEQTVDGLLATESVQLFVDRAGRANPAFRLTDVNAAAVARICRRLDGIPLAIELGAARVRALTAADLADQLDERIALAGAKARGVPDRQTTLRASIDWSYRLLTAAEQAAFRCLACFAGPFTTEAFTAVTDQVGRGRASRTGIDDAETLGTKMLPRLVDKSLVATLAPPSDAYTTYRLVESIREFSTEEAEREGDLASIRDAHADYYTGWLAKFDAAEATDDVLEAIGSEYPNIRTALQWSIDQRSARAADLVAAVGSAWHQLSMFHDAVVLGDGALRVVDGDRPAWAVAVGALAMARLLAGDLTFTTTAVPAAQNAARERADHRTQAWCCVVQGSRPPFDAGQLTLAYELGRTSAPSAAAIAAASIASAGTVVDARRWSELAIELTEGLGNTSLTAATAVARAEHLIECGRMDEALDLVLPITVDRAVMPAVRLLAVGRVVHAAFQRGDERVGSEVETTVDDIALRWPDRGVWRVGLQGLRMALLRSEPSSALPREPSGWLMRIAHTPGLLRTYCRLAIDNGHRLDPVALARSVTPPEPGSLMAASIAGIEGAYAAADGRDELAAQRWSTALAAAAPNGYLLLVCDALEALGCLAARAGQPGRAAVLLDAASRCRADIAYRFRFGYEQSSIDSAVAAVAAWPPPGRALGWQEAATLALSDGG